jgi:hypothetical protein
MSIEIKIQEDGTIALPSDLNNVITLSPEELQVATLAAIIEQIRIDSGVTTEELVYGLQEERHRYFKERYQLSAGD